MTTDIASSQPDQDSTQQQSSDTTPVATKIRTQLEYYFSAENLIHDSYLLSQMTNAHYVPVSLLAQFYKMRQLTQNVQDIIQAIEESDKLELDESKQFVRPANLKVFELKSLRVIGVGISGIDLQNILSQHVSDPNAVSIHADFVSPMQPGASSWIVKCNDEAIAQQLYAELAQHQGRIVYVEILRENILKRQTPTTLPSPTSLQVSAKPFVPSTSNAPTQQTFGAQRYGAGNRHYNRQENSRRASSVGSSAASVSSNDHNQSSQQQGKTHNGKQFQRNHQNHRSQNHRDGANRRTYSKDGSSPNNTSNTSTGARRKFNRDRQSPAPSGQSNNSASQKEFSKNKSQQQRNGQYSKKHITEPDKPQTHKSSQSTPAPSLNANNYPSLSKSTVGGKTISTDTTQQDQTPAPSVAPSVTTPSGFSFAEIATKAKDIVAPKRARVAATVVPSSATSSESSSIQSADATQEQKGAEKNGSANADKRRPSSKATADGEFIVPKTKKGRRPQQQKPAESNTAQEESTPVAETAETTTPQGNSYASVLLSSGGNSR